MGDSQLERKRITVTGQVQGVGFRPFVYRLAAEMGLTGWVLNDARGVTIEVQGRPLAIRGFANRLRSGCPPLAQVTSCDVQAAECMAGEKRFDIRPSEGGEFTDAQITVDIATCGDCLREMNDPADPRHKYPFINCTNCGPRYSIVRRIPYDRPNTTMAEFAMCPLCARQYADPGDRRFHAQPVACPACGPAVCLVDPKGRQIACDDVIARARKMLLSGQILAVKGLGGFQLACRADDEHAARRLRQRKRRDAKPFAIMVADLAAAAELCKIAPAAEQLLTGHLRPIVIMPSRADTDLAYAVAGDLDTLAVMLPYTPLHHLLLAGKMPPLVMTSGNYSEEPLVKDNDAAVAHLGRIADAMLIHNRNIERRVDDSIVQIHYDGRPSVVRRARGYAPQPISLRRELWRITKPAQSDQAVLAVGAELRNTVCLLKQGRAVVSEHIGDLKDGRAYRHFIDTINHLETLFDARVDLIAADMHPQYLSTEYARRRHTGDLAGRTAVPLVRVQHHHAHIAACLAENAQAGPVIGLACDGVGYGDDGAVWGCEILEADIRGYRRLGHLRYMPLVGGDAAATETYRPALAALHDAFGEACAEYAHGIRTDFPEEKLQAAAGLLTVDVSCPPSSSLGRWFDAVAWLCDLAERNRFEGEAPMMLEAAIQSGVDQAYDFHLVAEGPFTIDLRPAVEQIVGDLRNGQGAGMVAAKFHNTVVSFLVASALRAREETQLDVVALSGGCFANRYLTARLVEALEAEGLRVLRHRMIPCNDGGIALGQAVVAAAGAAAAAAEPAADVRAREDKTE